MNDYVTDTHALYWYLANDNKLGKKARKIFSKAAKGEVTIWISSIVLAELYWLLEKQNKTNLFLELFEQLKEADQFNFVDFTANDVLQFKGLSKIGEMHDRIIAVVAKNLDSPCITKDEEIIKSDLIEIIW